MSPDLKQIGESLQQLHCNHVMQRHEQVEAAKEFGKLVKQLEAEAQRTSKVIKQIEGSLKQLGLDPSAVKPSKPDAGPSKQQVKDQVLAAARTCLEKHGELSDTKLREAIKRSLPKIDLTGRLRRFAEWLQADERVTEVSPGVWTLQTVAPHTASESQPAETPAKRQLPPR